ncbi:MAG: type II toxin-antitoxin system VapC family toxin [Pyrinomonadaceae bacterium]
MADYLIDLTIFTAVFRGDDRLRRLIENLDSAVDSIVYLELLQATRNSSEAERVEKYLTLFELIYFDKKVAQRAFELTRLYSKNFGLRLPDSIIAATCLEHDLTLITHNVKDFQFIKDLKIFTL